MTTIQCNRNMESIGRTRKYFPHMTRATESLMDNGCLSLNIKVSFESSASVAAFLCLINQDICLSTVSLDNILSFPSYYEDSHSLLVYQQNISEESSWSATYYSILPVVPLVKHLIPMHILNCFFVSHSLGQTVGYRYPIIIVTGHQICLLLN